MSTEKGTPVPEKATFEVVLSKLMKGANPVIANAHCQFSYHWDFETNMGLATLDSINHNYLNLTLNPTGLAGRLAFMSSMEPLPVVINGQRVVLNRIILNVMLNDDSKLAGIMFNEDGSVIQVTDNWNANDAF